jgi:hypothetical protein
MRRRHPSLFVRSCRFGALAGAAAFALLARGAPARALTAEDIEKASAAATSGLVSVTERLASDDFGGRNNDSPTSPRVERYMLSRLRALGEGLIQPVWRRPSANPSSRRGSAARTSWR